MKVTLKAARINNGFTQMEAASKIGVSKDTIRNWEKGKSFPDLKFLRIIENVYNVAYDDIIFLSKYNA